MKLKGFTGQKETKILKSFRLKMSIIQKLESMASENSTTMTNIVEFIISEKFKEIGGKIDEC